jgi:hypothetical protein
VKEKQADKQVVLDTAVEHVRPYSDPEMGDSAGPWLTFVEAKDELTRLSGWGPERVVEWLSRKGADGSIPVRCLAHKVPPSVGRHPKITHLSPCDPRC